MSARPSGKGKITVSPCMVRRHMDERRYLLASALDCGNAGSGGQSKAWDVKGEGGLMESRLL